MEPKLGTGTQLHKDAELFKMLQMMGDMGITIKVDPKDNKTLVSSFDKGLIPFLTEMHPRVEKPIYNKDSNYHTQFWKVFITNELLVASLKEIAMEKCILEQKVSEYRKIYKELEIQIKPRKKKRRPDCEIKKNFLCPYNKCKRRYGSDVSLNLHIKRKHKGGNKSDRERMAKAIFSALKSGTQPPVTEFSLPEDFLTEVQTEFQRLKAEKFIEDFDPNVIFGRCHQDGNDPFVANNLFDDDKHTFEWDSKKMKNGFFNSSENSDEGAMSPRIQNTPKSTVQKQ